MISATKFAVLAVLKQQIRSLILVRHEELRKKKGRAPHQQTSPSCKRVPVAVTVEMFVVFTPTPTQATPQWTGNPIELQMHVTHGENWQKVLLLPR